MFAPALTSLIVNVFSLWRVEFLLRAQARAVPCMTSVDKIEIGNFIVIDQLFFLSIRYRCYPKTQSEIK